MTTQEYLEQAFIIDKRINSKIDQVSSLHSLSMKASSTFSDVPPSGTRNVHRMEEVIAKMVDLENEINEEIDVLVDLKLEIMGVIRKVEDSEYRLLLELRYLCFKTWEQVASDMGYDLSWVYRLHKKALSAIESEFNKTSHEKQ